MSGTPYTPEDLAYIQGMSICNSAMDKMHTEALALRRLHGMADNLMRLYYRLMWRWVLVALAGWVTAAVGWAGLWWVTG